MTSRWRIGAAVAAAVMLCVGACALVVRSNPRQSWQCYVPLVECLDIDTGLVVIYNERFTSITVTVTTENELYRLIVGGEGGERSVTDPDACTFTKIVARDGPVLGELDGTGECRTLRWIFRADGTVELLDYWQEWTPGPSSPPVSLAPASTV